MARLAEGLRRGEDGVVRCFWAGSDPLYTRYHDEEWGFPVADDRRLFEKICLEGFQSGLSWLTILRKRESFRAAFRGFDFDAVARFGARDVARLLKDAGHRPPPRQDRVHDQQRAPGPRAGRGDGLARRVLLVVRAGGRRPAEAPHLAGPPDHGEDARLDRPQQGPQEARLHLRRPDDRLRLHAGHGPRERPRRGLRRPRARRARPRPLPPAAALPSRPSERRHRETRQCVSDRLRRPGCAS